MGSPDRPATAPLTRPWLLAAIGVRPDIPARWLASAMPAARPRGTLAVSRAGRQPGNEGSDGRLLEVACTGRGDGLAGLAAGRRRAAGRDDGGLQGGDEGQAVAGWTAVLARGDV